MTGVLIGLVVGWVAHVEFARWRERVNTRKAWERFQNLVLHAEADRGCELLIEDAIYRDQFHELPKDRKAS